MSTRSTSMMPLALDLMSTLVVGSIFPVATTDRAIVPPSTAASREGSTPPGEPASADKPHAAAPTRTTVDPPYRTIFRDLVWLIGVLTWGSAPHPRPPAPPCGARRPRATPA